MNGYELDCRLAECLERFETAWDECSGEPPRIEDFLPDDASLHSAARVSLVCVDLARRMGGGEETAAESYLQRYPELLADREARVRIVEAEFIAARRARRAGTLEEYRRRFADLWKDLAPRLQAVVRGVPRSALDGLADLPSDGRYTDLELEGWGGHAVVFAAYDRELRRRVAVKRVHAACVGLGLVLCQSWIDG